MINHRSWICAGALTVLTTAPCFALASWFPPSKGGSGPAVSHSAPGPVVGVGLPALVIGGYLWYRNRSKGSKK